MSVKFALRTALGFVWIYEGLILKLLVPSPSLVGIVQASHLYWPTPESTVTVLGVVQIGFGLWLLFGWQERVAAMAATVFMCGLVSAAVVFQPSALADPYGGIPKDIVLVAAAFGVWRLAGQPARART